MGLFRRAKPLHEQLAEAAELDIGAVDGEGEPPPRTPSRLAGLMHGLADGFLSSPPDEFGRPSFWRVDENFSKTTPITNNVRLQVRLEAFNLLNNFNWGNPNLNFSAGTFGRITTTAGDPRIIQLGIKYGF